MRVCGVCVCVCVCVVCCVCLLKLDDVSTQRVRQFISNGKRERPKAVTLEEGERERERETGLKEYKCYTFSLCVAMHEAAAASGCAHIAACVVVVSLSRLGVCCCASRTNYYFCAFAAAPAKGGLSLRVAPELSRANSQTRASRWT
jgi:hypothetical protein